MHENIMMFNHQSAFEKLSTSLNGLKIHSLNSVEYDEIGLHPNYLLTKIGLQHENLIECEVVGQSYGVSKGGASNSNVNGVTVIIKSGSLFEQVVFIQRKPPREPGQSDELFEHWKYLTNLCALAHELGHVKDLQRVAQSNFTISEKCTVNLVGAEVYAHTYCLQYLSDIGATMARSVMAKGIYEAAVNGRKFQKEVYAGICKNLGKGRLKKWIKN